MPFPYRRVHMVGIGGAGMSAIAEALLADGVQVMGSDLEASSYTERLQHKGAKVFIGHDAQQVGDDTQAVIVSSAIAPNNPEIAEARRRRLPILHRADALAMLMEGKTSIAVAGTHGKSTTTAMIGHILACAGYDPTVLVGAEVINFSSNCRVGRSRWFVTEADESDGSFLKLSPTHIVITNIELDHPDRYADEESVTQAFQEFAERINDDGLLVVNADCPKARRLPFQLSRTVWWASFGIHSEADYEGRGLRRLADGSWVIGVCRRPKVLGEIRLRVPGEHNAANALAALTACVELGVPFWICSEALANFRGVRRRFEIVGVVNGITVVDDYAHHPTEIRALLSAARQVFPDGRLWVVFQPHRYTRTQRLWREFGDAFSDADGVWVTEIFAASEPPIEGISGNLIVKAVRAQAPSKPVQFAADWDVLVNELTATARTGDAILLVGAGNIYKLAAKLIEALSKASG